MTLALLCDNKEPSAVCQQKFRTALTLNYLYGLNSFNFHNNKLFYFRLRPIKRINYAGGSANRTAWRAPQRRGDESFRSEKKIESGEKLFQVRNLKPKTITVIARDDSANRAKMILNRRTAMTYDSVLQTVSDILQLNSGPVKDLYTLEGKKVLFMLFLSLI